MNDIDQQRTFLRDILYVLNQARAFRVYVDSGTKQQMQGHPFEQTIHNALLESSLAFLRKLNEFFGGKRDASARFLLPNYASRWLFDNIIEKKLLDERVMHLSLGEAKEGKLDWSTFYSKHLDEAEKRFEDFLNTLKLTRPDLLE